LCRKFADTAIASLIIDNKSLLVDHLQTDPTVFEEVVSIHPGDALPGNMRWHLSYNGLTAQKILVARGSQPHPVRFSQIALAPSAHDYATLELIFRQDWRLGSQVDQLLALENQLAADLGQPDLTPKQAETLSPEEDAIQSICHIRKLALQNGTDHVSHYKRCLRYLTLFPLLGFEPDYFYSSRELRYYLHLLLLLAHLSQPAPAQTSGAAAINWSEHKVRLNGRWHQLSKPEFAVFHYLWERMGQVCSIKMLYDCYRRAQYPASQLEDRENPSPRDMQATTQTVISRLRQKLKANKNWPIETVRSSGYKLVELTIE
ncbi:MAG: winged helix-turn-helix transcriptional regulator, partial [Anaerolineales bacterium]|nr:winged helix-turn-helix transcriptional regulator [Anaerolineales bacterium]